VNAKELVAKVKFLPPASPAAMRLINLLNHGGVDNDLIVEGLRSDIVLTAKLLRVCNSSVFSFEESISSVDQALLVLGHREVLRIILALACGGMMATPLPGYAVAANELWSHSLVAATAAEIATKSSLDLEMDAQVAFTAGLLHDIGKLVLGQLLTEDVQAQIRADIKQQRISRAEAERLVLGTDHAEVGGCLLASWGLPQELVEAVANHHHPIVKPQPGYSTVTHLADCLAHLSGSAPGWEAYAIRVSDEVVEALNITPARLEEMVLSVQESAKSLTGIANLAK
jgi:putative nucleotidyltransferase with HDIG domain